MISAHAAIWAAGHHNKDAMKTKDFLPVTEHFEALVDGLDHDNLLVYNSMRHVRVETAFRGRRFVVYKVGTSGMRQLDEIRVLDFECNDDEGASARIQSSSRPDQRDLIVGYRPVRLFDYPVFLWLPLHSKIRWSTADLKSHSLAFPLVIRTVSRLHLRETGVVYFETSVAAAKEFGSAVVE